MKPKSIIVVVVVIISFLGCNVQNEIKEADFPELSGLYLGQQLQGTLTEIFAPNLISNGMDNRDLAITPDGKEIYSTIKVGGTEYVTIIVWKQKDGFWTKPEVVSFGKNPNYMFYEPCISNDGKKLFFTSNMPVHDSTEISEPNIWFVDRIGDTWSEPNLLPTTINSTFDEYFPSVTNDGTLYFTRGSETGEYFIYRSKYINGNYHAAEKLPKQVNSGITRFNSFIDRDEKYMILSVYGLNETYGGMDYYIVFRNEDDTWNDPINLGSDINTKGSKEYSSYVSPDGKYLFFMSQRSRKDSITAEGFSYNFLKKMHNEYNNGSSDIYWTSTKIIEDLRPQ